VFCAGDSCAMGDVCCADPTTQVAVCQAPDVVCDAFVIRCDETLDCPEGQRCCGDGSGTSCSDTCTGGQICRSNGECGTGARCCPPSGHSVQGEKHIIST
jgi:hypothetical protein